MVGAECSKESQVTAKDREKNLRHHICHRSICSTAVNCSKYVVCDDKLFEKISFITSLAENRADEDQRAYFLCESPKARHTRVLCRHPDLYLLAA